MRVLLRFFLFHLLIALRRLNESWLVCVVIQRIPMQTQRQSLILIFKYQVHCRNNHNSHRCTGLYGQHCHPCHFMLHSLHFDCPIAVFPQAPLSIHLCSPVSCPVAFLSITLPTPSLFAARCGIFYCLTHMAHLLCTHPQDSHKCPHIHWNVVRYAHTCTQIQGEINRAFWNAKHNSTQQRRAACCQVSTK